MTRRILLHCGFPKTGTSALQVQLAKGRGELLHQGVDYIRMGDFETARQGKISSGNGAGLAQSFLPPHHEASLAHRRGEILPRFLEVIDATPEDKLMSSEFFAAIPPRFIGMLVEALRPLGEVSLIYFIRDQLSLMTATYVQRVKRHGLTQFPEEFFANWDHFKPSLSYYSYLKAIREAAPGATVLVAPYEQAQVTEGGLMGMLTKMIGTTCTPALAALDRPINLSPAAKEIRLMLEINRHQPRMQFSDMLVEASVRAMRSELFSNRTILPPDIRDAVYAFFEPENEAFFREFLDSENLYALSHVASEYTDLRAIEFSATDVMMILSGIMTDLDRRLARLEKRATP